MIGVGEVGDMEDLRVRWTYLYHDLLPALAASKSVVQPRWPVRLDHCFARILLDNAVGQNRPWYESVKSPAVKNMTATQLNAAIKMAEEVASGVANLVDLNERSLELRQKMVNKVEKRKVDVSQDPLTPKKQRRLESATISSYFKSSPAAAVSSEPSEHAHHAVDADRSISGSGSSLAPTADMNEQLRSIEESDLTPFRKLMLRLLCQIPRGRYSTYQCMADHVTRTSHKTCARAVGSAMRNNPFAPDVPCHRILAAGGRLGGFGGSWGENGKHAAKKHELLGDEGVKFDSRGIVKGPPFRDFR